MSRDLRVDFLDHRSVYLLYADAESPDTNQVALPHSQCFTPSSVQPKIPILLSGRRFGPVRDIDGVIANTVKVVNTWIADFIGPKNQFEHGIEIPHNLFGDKMQGVTIRMRF